MTPEQYYWFVRRPQTIRAYAAGNTKSIEEIRYEEFMKTFVKHRSYFYSGTVSDYDYTKASERFTPPPSIGCSAVRGGRFMGRNLDYYYDNTPEFLIHTPARQGRYATIAITQFPAICESDVESKNTVFRDSIGRLPFAVMDGMNEYGLVTEQNMLPVGDNPDFPLETNDLSNPVSPVLHQHWNRTFHTRPGKPRRSVSMLQRTVLDSCKNVNEAVALITGEYDWFSFFGITGGDFTTSGLELHWMISDPSATVIIELVNTGYSGNWKTSISDIVVHWYVRQFPRNTYGKTSITRYRNGEQIQTQQTGISTAPIMTNFHVTGWNGSYGSDGSVKVPILNTTFTRYSMGLERHRILGDGYNSSDFGNEQRMSQLLDSARYTKAYETDHSESYTDRIWYSEYNDPLCKDEGFPQGVHIGLSEAAIEERAESTCDFCREKIQAQERMSASDKDCPWITVNSSVYDMENRTLSVIVQEDNEVRKFGF